MLMSKSTLFETVGGACGPLFRFFIITAALVSYAELLAVRAIILITEFELVTVSLKLYDKSDLTFTDYY